MSLECSHCEHDIRGGHADDCPRPNDLNWRTGMPDNKAEAIVDAILADLGGRKGVGDELDAIDEEIYAEMKAELVEKVATQL